MIWIKFGKGSENIVLTNVLHIHGTGEEAEIIESNNVITVIPVKSIKDIGVM